MDSKLNLKLCKWSKMMQNFVSIVVLNCMVVGILAI